MAGLRYESISKSYGEVPAVRNLNLDVRDGEFLVLLGPSGCGKTTLLRLTAGLEEVTSGNVWMDGGKINDLPPKDRNIAMVFQSYALYPHLTVAENIGYPLKIRKFSQAEIRQKVASVSQQLGLASLLNRRPKELSGGQRQRVALGRAIIRKPGVFLMDEPLSNLDAQLRVQMRAEIKRLQKDLGVTTLYVTHDQVEAMSMASRIAIFRDGTLHQVDTPEGIFSRPADRFVAGFVGTPPMNFIPATSANNRITFNGEGSYSIACPPGAINDGPGCTGRGAPSTGRHSGSDLQAGTRVQFLIGVRPQDIRFTQTAGLAGKVYVTEPLGDEYHVIIESGESRLTVKCASDPGFKPGEAVRLQFDEQRIHLFNPETGKRIDAFTSTSGGKGK